MDSKNKTPLRKMVFSAIYLAIAMMLPFLTGQIPQIGAMLSPMHIPVLLCGFVCGWPWGMAVGLIAPVMRSVIFGMPELYPTAIAMTFELAVYGLISGLVYKMLPKRIWSIYAALIAAMASGRIVWGIARFIMAGLGGSEFSASMFIAGALTMAVPGIILHIVIIPPLVRLFEKTGLSENIR